MLPEERRNPENAGNVARDLRPPSRPDPGVPALQRPPAVHARRCRRGCASSPCCGSRTCTDCDYEWTHHVDDGQRGGADRRRHRRRPARRGRRRVRPRGAAPRSTNSTTSTNISDATWAALGEHFDERQRMDLVFTVGCYGTLAMAFNTFGVEPDTGEVIHVALLPEAGRGQLDRELAGTRHRAGQLRGLDRPGALQARAAGDLQEDLAQRRPGRAAAQEGQLLHPRDAVGRARARR